MESKTVLVEREGGLAIVTLNRPERMNSLSSELLSTLLEYMRALAANREVRCVMLTGSGDRAFSAGGDVNQMASPRQGEQEGENGNEPMEAAIHGLQRGQESAFLLHTMPKPTLAAINGAAAGAGLSLAAACDLRIASDHAIFTTAFARIGVSGDYGGSYFLTQLLGTAKARELYFLCDRLNASEALRIGLVNFVVPKEHFQKEALTLARRLAEGPPIAFGYMKRNLNLGLAGRALEALNMEAEGMVRTMQTEDFFEAAQAFLEKRVPNFNGH